MAPGLVFALLLLTLVIWFCLPLIPALLELMNPRDASPLSAVGTDAGRLTYFADSFTSRCEREGLLGTMLPPQLSDGSRVLAHSAGTPITPQTSPIADIVVVMDDEPLPAGATLEAECLARRTLRGGANVSYRALLGQRDVILGPQSLVHRWVHARGRLEVADGSRLFGRATCERDLLLGRGVSFERLDAYLVRVSSGDTPEPSVRATEEYALFDVPAHARAMAPNYWRLDESLVVPAASRMFASVISTGSISVLEGACVVGSLKAHRQILIRSGAVVKGSITARELVTIERGARVTGPVISEAAVIVDAATIGSATVRTTVAAPRIRLMPGASIYGAVMAGEEGQTAT